jgi:hypothetical protein
MRTLRKILSLLIALSLLLGTPIGGFAASADSPCAAAGMSDTVPGCCDNGMDMAGCSVACSSASPVAAVGGTAQPFPPAISVSPPNTTPGHRLPLARAPDTQPPKHFSA